MNTLATDIVLSGSSDPLQTFLECTPLCGRSNPQGLSYDTRYNLLRKGHSRGQGQTVQACRHSGEASRDVAVTKEYWGSMVTIRHREGKGQFYPEPRGSGSLLTWVFNLMFGTQIFVSVRDL